MLLDEAVHAGGVRVVERSHVRWRPLVFGFRQLLDLKSVNEDVERKIAFAVDFGPAAQGVNVVVLELRIVVFSLRVAITEHDVGVGLAEDMRYAIRVSMDATVVRCTAQSPRTEGEDNDDPTMPAFHGRRV